MSEDWFTDPDSTGTLTVVWRDTGWYVAETAMDCAVRCNLPEDVSLQRSAGPHQIDVRVGKFVHAIVTGPSYLFIDRIDGVGSTAGPATDSSGGTTTASLDETKERHQTSDGRSSDRTMLDEIAREKIGDEEFTLSEEEDDSVVGQAKKRARSQGRDPAIDPTFQYTDGEDEED